ncbi:MAG: beta-N-acetylglucosaminidase domain-containing protein [Cellvibrionales bacterium]|nr:beta-N-acetylglucosaminidase domain-containing protein [Cellvibrionales bacterium]
MHVLEGFYGKPWSLNERLDMLDFLATFQFAGFCYAPKSDKKLRGDMLTLFTDAELTSIQTLAKKSSDNGLRFTVGLSPIHLLNQPDNASWQQKCQQLLSIPNAQFALFFDDMPAGETDLAMKQCHFFHRANALLDGRVSLFCPTFYSDDPVLERLFGEKPENYFEVLASLPKEIDIFWTGQKVITRAYDVKALHTINNRLNRKVTLWDNAFVNDGRKTSQFLPIGVTANYSEAGAAVNDIYINPMNQPSLAKINLLMANKGLNLNAALNTLMPKLTALIANYLPEFKKLGRDSLSTETIQAMQADFSESQHPAAKEIMAWLKGEYIFDPACLT